MCFLLARRILGFSFFLSAHVLTEKRMARGWRKLSVAGPRPVDHGQVLDMKGFLVLVVILE